MRKVFVGMSGGVDSSVAALLLRQAGEQVSGLWLRLLDAGGEEAGARAAADRLGIPLHTSDLSDLFRREVVGAFISEYAAGRTPNPCVVCNRLVKFGAMWDWARALGADCLATGHYARVRRDPATGRWLLLRGADPAKDQSYFLYALSQEQLSRALFPLGELRKEEVRQLAEARGLPAAGKRDSQDLCFAPDGDYAAFIARTVGQPSPTGDFLDTQGRVLGRHKGFARYTRGQHKGLGLPIEPPLYVLDKDPLTHSVTLGPDEALWERELTAGDLNWISVPALTEALRVTVKTRHSRREAAAILEPLPDGRVRAVFDEPQRALTPGQAAVFYDGETVVGGGTICRT